MKLNELAKFYTKANKNVKYSQTTKTNKSNIKKNKTTTKPQHPSYINKTIQQKKIKIIFLNYILFS